MAPRSETYVVSLAVNKTCFVLVFFFSRCGRLQLLRFQTSHLYSYFLTFSSVVYFARDGSIFGGVVVFPMVICLINQSTMGSMSINENSFMREKPKSHKA